MNWADLTAFHVLTEERHFTRAAARLGTSQPAVSVRIARLERALGARLVDRTSRGALPTPAGRRLAEWVAATRRGWDEIRLVVAETATSDTSGGARGRSTRGRDRATTAPQRVRIGTARFAGHHAVDRLGRQQPRIDWALRTTAGPTALVERLLLDEVQIGFWCAWPYTPPVDLSGLREFAVRQLPLVVALTDTHRLAGDDGPVDLADLAGEEWVAGADPELREALRRVCRQAGGFRPVITHVTDDQAQVAALVAAGRAVTVEVASTPPATGVVRRPVLDAPAATLRLAWRPGAVPESLVRDVLRSLADDTAHLDAEPGVSVGSVVPPRSDLRCAPVTGPGRDDVPGSDGAGGPVAWSGRDVRDPETRSRRGAPDPADRRRLVRSADPGAARPRGRSVPVHHRPAGEPRPADPHPDRASLARPAPSAPTAWFPARGAQERPR
ncbi:LysR family transcriptional regulator [Micromonospora maritima]|uniref:LysR family transcriptional regulator n=1 Tax=Micromonospora maritima TaxID=986711 RepID=UPI00157E175E|nr:LysR family transcriptional regulator [Micromonospora maritima]